MSAVSETIVREYFESHDFFVRQHRKYISTVRQDEEIDFLVQNPRFEAPPRALPFELAAGDLKHIARAVVVVLGWHSEIIYVSQLTSTPEIFRFLEPAALKQAEASCPGPGSLSKLLVVPALPVTAESRQQTIECLKSKGLDGVISFKTILAALIDQVKVNRNYQKSDLLQTLRILKNYEFFKEPQLELFTRKRRPASPRQRARKPKTAE